MVSVPDLEAVKAYLGDSAVSDSEISSAIDTEYELQVLKCGDRSDNYPASLAEALKRRVAVNLARKPIVLNMVDTETGMPQRFSMNDPEIRRLEATFRRIVFG